MGLKGAPKPPRRKVVRAVVKAGGTKKEGRQVVREARAIGRGTNPRNADTGVRAKRDIKQTKQAIGILRSPRAAKRFARNVARVEATAARRKAKSG